MSGNLSHDCWFCRTKNTYFEIEHFYQLDEFKYANMYAFFAKCSACEYPICGTLESNHKVIEFRGNIKTNDNIEIINITTPKKEYEIPDFLPRNFQRTFATVVALMGHPDHTPTIRSIRNP